MASRQGPDFRQLLVALARALDARGVGYMLIGGQAVLLHGQPRLTEDLDVTLALDPSGLSIVRLVCADVGLTPLPENVDDFVNETFVLPVRHVATTLRVDFIFSSTEYERSAIACAERVDLDGARIAFATAEDLIIHKLFAARPRDIEDVRGVLRRKGAGMDWAYLRHWASAFAEIPGRERMVATLAELRAEAGSNTPGRGT